jgi:hypothetical protein
MQVFGKDIIGPMFHHLFPNKEFSVAKMKLPALTTYLTFIRLAYPAFKEQLHTATGRADLTVRQQTVLQNMTDLVEFFIPVVSLLFAVLICAVVLQPFLSYASQLCVGIIPIQILFTKKKKQPRCCLQVHVARLMCPNSSSFISCSPAVGNDPQF